jgi:hypothetical protein
MGRNNNSTLALGVQIHLGNTFLGEPSTHGLCACRGAHSSQIVWGVTMIWRIPDLIGFSKKMNQKREEREK